MVEEQKQTEFPSMLHKVEKDVPFNGQNLLQQLQLVLTDVID